MTPLDPRERAVLAVLESVTDRRTVSPELAARSWEDFATLWELSQYRTTVLDALGFAGAAGCRALELGCGLGSLTRWLGERFARVDAVETSPEHAAVAALRCADLPGVTIHPNLPAGESYDLVVLHDPEDLPIAFAALATDGLALLLTRNRTGLKYLNGALDDDTGKSYTSLAELSAESRGAAESLGALNAESLRAAAAAAAEGGSAAPTLGELRAAAEAAGFATADVLMPHPDHRLASTVLDPAAFGDDAADAANWLFGTAPNRGAGAGTPRTAVVSETLAQRAAAQAGLLAELSNSYALLCRRGSPERLGVDRSWAARHWSFDRRPACRKRVTRTVDGRIVNELAAGGTEGRAASIELGVIDHRLADEPLRRGPLVAFRALAALTGDGHLGALVAEYARWLVETFGVPDQVDGEGVPLLRGDALDAIWTNIVEAHDRWVAVDGEWAFRGALPLDYLVWRAVKDLPLRFAREARGLDVIAVSGVAPHRVELFMELEDAFHAAAGTGPTPTPSARIAPYVADATPRFRILASAAEITPELLSSYAALFADAPATLVLVAPTDAAAALPALQATLDAAGLDESTLPDTLLVDSGEADGDAVLSTTATWGPPGLPRFGPADLAVLRQLAGDA
jgi:SAM-dependent methyltransferase